MRKNIIFHLLKRNLMKPDESFLNYFIKNSKNKKISKCQSNYYLYSVMKEFIEEKYQEQIESEIFPLI